MWVVGGYSVLYISSLGHLKREGIGLLEYQALPSLLDVAHRPGRVVCGPYKFLANNFF